MRTTYTEHLGEPLNPYNPREALKMLKEFNKWRRAEGEYEWNEDPTKNKNLPFTPKDIGIALDTAIDLMDKALNLK